ncbi:murein transglycosylase A [Nostoc sp. UCD121]|uniref:murein transglycosylase A n=1 Tax=unclassified Nostoc TaxID=2593658 RepID=UPI001625B5AC|nr:MULTISPECIES: murein transglycosylase A [unclassified Nostoc]MBC1224041.1 murein transglycosylase A [Nostoc sp. UCD120]MBC1276095.1 murein transglycosylase A [Nostoc sp. UCD121]MBC1294642.1 murein transglycosylase A [Nostoc sp. UCD122]
MRKTLALLSLSLGVVLVNPLWSAVAQVPNLLPLPIPTTPDLSPVPIPITPEITPPLKPIAIGSDCTLQQRCLGWDDQIWGQRGKTGDRNALLASIDNSLIYLTKGEAIAAYQNYPIKEITLDRVRRSLLRFRQLVVSSKSPAQLQSVVRREFVFYQSVGNDGKGTVKFTAYYEPVYTASRVKTAVYKYPLYRLPPDFSQWPKPHPKRIDLEGKDGLQGNKSKLRGLELLWFRDRLDAYMVHIQGSAQIKLTNGKTTSVGYAGGTDYPWTSIGKELAKDGKLPLNGLTMPRLISYFRQKPQELNNYLPRWERFIFFQETSGRPATGSIHVPVTAERSIATDKSLMPPGALALIYNSFPYPASRGKLERRTVSRFVLDQDTGSAIKGPGRVDYFMGSGKLAGDRAGITGGNGSLYYLLLKE